MLKFEFKEIPAVIIVLATLAAAIGLLGTNPLAPSRELDPYTRAAFGVLATGLAIAAFSMARIKTPEVPRPTDDYRERFDAAQEEFARLTPDFDIIAELQIGRVKFAVLNANILQATTDVIVSSDDNHFTARGGVAKADLTKAGPDVYRQLERFRKHRFRQGQIALTTGGNWNIRALIHAAVIDLEENRFPNEATIRRLTRRSLECAVAIGAHGITFPVLGGGTASKFITPQESVRALASETIEFLQQHLLDEDVTLTYVAIHVFNRADASGLPAPMNPNGNT